MICKGRRGALKGTWSNGTWGGRPNLLLEQEGDDPINENESAEISSSRFCLSLRK